MPALTAESTRKTPSELAPAAASKPPKTSSVSDRFSARSRMRRRLRWARTRSRAGARPTRTAALEASTATAPKTARHLAATARVGTASPASRVAAGTAACLKPNASPRRLVATVRASAAFTDGCVAAFARPPAVIATSTQPKLRASSEAGQSEGAAERTHEQPRLDPQAFDDLAHGCR